MLAERRLVHPDLVKLETPEAILLPHLRGPVRAT